MVVGSTEDLTDGLRRVEQARGRVWAAYLSSWVVYGGAVLLVVFGLVEDLASDWAGLFFLTAGSLGLVFGVVGSTRRGRAWLRLPALPRSAWLGTGHRGTKRSQALLVAVWAATIGMAAFDFRATFGAVGNGEQSGPPVPYTVLFSALALLWLAGCLAGRRWAHRKMAGHGGG